MRYNLAFMNASTDNLQHQNGTNPAFLSPSLPVPSDLLQQLIADLSMSQGTTYSVVLLILCIRYQVLFLVCQFIF